MSLPTAQVKRILAAETRLVRRVDIPGISGVILTRMWPEINKQDMPACIEFLRDNTNWMGLDQAGNDKTTNPRIEYQEFPGSFVGGIPRLEWGQSDPATGPTTNRLNLVQDLYLLNLTGPSSIIEDSCRRQVTAYTVYFSSTPPSVAGLHSTGVMWTVSDPVLDLSTGLYQATVKRIERLEQAFSFESEDIATHSETTAVKLGTRDAPSALTPGDGELKTQQIQKNEDCTNDETVQTQTAVNQHGSAQELRADQTSATDVNTQAGSELAPSAADGQIVNGRSTPTRFKNRWETSLETITAVDQTETAEEVRADQTSARTTHTQASAAITTPPVPSDGETRTATNQPTAFKSRWRTTLETVTGVDQTETTGEVRADQTTARTVHTQATAVVTNPPTPADGEIRTAINQPTQFKNRWRTTEETVAAVDQTETVEEVRQDRTSSRTTHTQAAAQITSPPTPSSGEVRTATNQPTQFKNRWRTTLETVAAIDQTTTETEVRADVETSRTTHSFNASTLTTPPVAGDGQVVSATNAPTEFKDRTRTVAETQTAVNQHGSALELRADQTSATDVNTQAGAELSPSAGDGQIVNGRSTPTRFKNRWETTLETITAVDQTETTEEVRQDRTTSRTVHTQASAAITTPPVPSSGEVRTAINQPTQFKNRWRTTAETVTAVDQTTTEAEVRADVETSRTTHSFNASTLTTPPVAGDGQVVSATNQPTEFKDRTRTVAETQTAVNQHGSAAEIRADQTSATDVNTQAGAELAPSAGDGQIVNGRSTPTRFKNRWETSLETITAVDQTTSQGDVQADRSVATTIHSQNTATVTVPPTPADGESRRAVNRPTPFKNRWETTAVTATATKIETGTLNYSDSDGSHVLAEAVNLTAAEVVTMLSLYSDPTKTVTPSITISREFKNRFDVAIRGREANTNAATFGDAFSTGTIDWPYTNQRTGQNYHVYIRFTTSMMIAHTFLITPAAGGTIVGSDSGNKTGITYVGRGRIAATRVELV